MLALDILKKPDGLPDRPIYAVAGDDVYLRGEVTKQIAARAIGDPQEDLGITQFIGDSAKLAQVLDELRTLPFLAKRRVVVIESADPFVTAHRKELEQYAEHPSQTGVLVLQVKSWPANTKLAKLVEKAGLAIECKVAEPKSVRAWLDAVAKNRHQLALESEAAQLLLDLVGPEPGLLAAELEKLAAAVGDAKAIKSSDVTRLVGGVRVEEVWKAIDAAASGRAQAALEGLDSLLAAGEPPVKLLAAISYALLRVHHAGQFRRAGIDAREACRRAGIFPNAVDRVLQQHTHLGPKRVADLPSRLLRADLELKGNSGLPPSTVLEKLFTELALPRRD